MNNNTKCNNKNSSLHKKSDVLDVIQHRSIKVNPGKSLISFDYHCYQINKKLNEILNNNYML